MNLNNIECFLAIAELQSISRAAEKLYLSQSTVSHRLKLLEKELDCELIDRAQGQRSSLLTPKGEAFLPLARRWLALNQDTKTFKKVSLFPSITVGCVDSLNIFFFDEFYSQMLADEVPIKLHLKTHSSPELYKRMEANTIDVAFTVEHIRSKDIVTEPIFREDLLLVCPPGYLPEGPVHPSSLDSAEELLIDWGTNEFQLWHDHWWSPNIAPFLEVNAPSFAVPFICKNNCWMVVPISIANRCRQNYNLEVHTLLDPPPQRICYKLAFRHPRSSHPEAERIFNSCLSRFLASIPWIDISNLNSQN